MRQYMFGVVTGLLLTSAGVWAFGDGAMTQTQRDWALQQLQFDNLARQQRQMDHQSGAYQADPDPC